VLPPAHTPDSLLVSSNLSRSPGLNRARVCAVAVHPPPLSKAVLFSTSLRLVSFVLVSSSFLSLGPGQLICPVSRDRGRRSGT
jgi:hypothetical protein